MGSENKVDLGNCTLYLDGKPIAWGQGELPEVTVPADVPKPESIALCESMEFTMHSKAPKRWRCKSRRRFIKLLMSYGISRNRAESMAKVARIAGIPYRELWRSFFFWI